MIFKVDFAIKLSKYRPKNSFICLKRICPQYCILSSTTIHSRSLPLRFHKNLRNFTNFKLAYSKHLLSLQSLIIWEDIHAKMKNERGYRMKPENLRRWTIQTIFNKYANNLKMTIFHRSLRISDLLLL